MHETAIVEGVMRILMQKADEHGMDRILSVRLRIGRLHGLDHRQLRGCFDIFAEGTPADGARLVIDEIPITARCRACDRPWEVAGYRFVCPACGAADAEVTGGRELYVESFEGRRAAEDDAQGTMAAEPSAR
ncbi:hydrogenase maturation nickel metallochaperone HypA [Azospirillum sp. ST 5-10]|uniref:hydrogenase maturation nickel metallochaperone HypA n=1 Tax=unclassified Azospirillum TaxID=2630922 RepID=UPI003F4A7FF1